MIVLGLESSGPAGGAAVVAEGRVLAEVHHCSRRSHSTRLMEAVDEVLRSTGLDLEQVDRLAVSRGPGSFTGVRIGVATAKTLAMATDRPVVGVDSLAVMAANLTGEEGLVVTVRDARKSEVYAGLYRIGERIPRRVAGPLNLAPERVGESWAGRLSPGPIWLLGDGLERYGPNLRSALPGEIREASPDLWEPRASQVALLAAWLDPSKLPPESSDPIRLAPLYVRRSEAEINRERRLEDRG